MSDPVIKELSLEILEKAKEFPSLIALLQAGKQWDIRSLLEIYQRWKQYLKLKKRTFWLNEENQIVTETWEGSEKKKRIVGRVLANSKPIDTNNTLERELVLRIAGRKDIWLEDDYSLIMRFRDMVLRCAGSKSIRNALWEIRANNGPLINNIQNNNALEGLEKRCNCLLSKVS